MTYSFNMNDYEFVISRLNMALSADRKLLENFLSTNGLLMEDDLEYVAVIKKDDKIVASGSVSGHVLKCIAVEEDFQGLGLTNRIVTDLITYQHSKQRDDFFIFTHPKNIAIFKTLNFHEIAAVDDKVALLENTQAAMTDYLNNLSLFRNEGKRICGIVVNCNPFTNGHRYLIEKASRECDYVHLFVVEEDKSVFPSEIRYDLVAKGVIDLGNVKVHRAGNYIISNVTFPSYFIKDSKKINDTHARLDLAIFSEKIAPVLGINVRYVGHEPYCPVTNHYNEVMKEVLPEKGIDVVEVPRMELGNKAVSASSVRKLFAEGHTDEIKDLVPQSTYDFLMSEEGQVIRNKIKGMLK